VQLGIILSLFALFFIISIPSAFAEVTITTVDESGFSQDCVSTGCYTPSVATVDVGDVVTMKNTDPTGVHTFTSGTVNGFTPSPDGTFDSSVLMSGDAFEWTPESAGEVPYYCMLHTWMVGNILVTNQITQKSPEQKVIENQTEELESSSTIPPLTNNVDVITYSEPDEILTSFLPSDYMKYNCGIGSCEFSKLSINEISDSSIEGLTSGIKQVYSQKNIDNIPALSKSTDRAFGITAGTDTFSDLSRGVYLDVQILEFDLQKNSQNYYDHITKSAINKGHLSNVFTECSFEHRGQPQDVGRYGVIDGMTTCQVQNYVVLSNVSTEVGGQAALETWYITEDYTYTPVQKTIKNIHNHLAQLDTNVLDMTPDSKNLVGQSNSIQVTGINIVKGSDYDLITMNLKGDIEFNQSNDLVQRTTEFALIDWELKKYSQGISESTKLEVKSFDQSGVQTEIITTKNLSFAFPNEKCTLDATINAQELGKPVESKVCFEIPKGKDHFQLIRIDEYSQSSGYFDKFIKTDSSNLVAQFDLDDIESSFGTMESMTDQSPNSSSNGGGGCLIATATYGSELAPQVQQLRELRDNQLLQTESGAAFMSTFNNVYYSFSPIIADYERENPLFKESVKLAITPLISSLFILNYVDMNSESEVLGYGISLIILNLGMYLGVPAVVIVGIRKRI
jgi:plastocyanin